MFFYSEGKKLRRLRNIVLKFKKCHVDSYIGKRSWCRTYRSIVLVVPARWLVGWFVCLFVCFRIETVCTVLILLSVQGIVLFFLFMYEQPFNSLLFITT